MTQVYEIVDKVKGFLEQDENVNKVSFGDFSEVDLDKTTIFPLSHFWITECGFVGTTMQFSLDMMFLDIVSESKEFVDSFYGNDDLHDILNTQHKVVTRLVANLKSNFRTNIDPQYLIVGEPVAEVLYEKFENKLAGWGLKVTFEVPNEFDNCI
jgi:hypothetical protein|tara:strand:- start:44 stop:505 length:462 start_codon:yes stop_codon:yes gene_type:complete